MVPIALMRLQFAAFGLVALSACSIFSPIPDSRSPADRAHELDIPCRGLSEATAAPILAKAAIDSVEPYLSTVQSGNGYATHLIGAKVHIKPLPSLTHEWLARELQCHEARVLLGVSPELAEDPYAQAGAWLKLDADSAGNGFVVRVQSFDFETANTALARAKRYAGLP